jgi:hypothetical protein
MGSRTADNADAAGWAAETGGKQGTFADAAFGEPVVNATAGLASLAALEAAGADNLRGKLLVDVSSPLDRSARVPRAAADVRLARRPDHRPGGPSTARGAELYVSLWLAVMGALGTPHFNIAISSSPS